MKRFLTLGVFLVALVAFNCIGTTKACPRACFVRRAVVQKAVAVQTTYAAPVIAQYATLAVFVPTYTAGYVPQAVVPVAVPAKAISPCADLQSQVQELQKAIQLLQDRSNPPPVPRAVAPKGVHLGLLALKKSCAACHEASVAEKDGGKLVLFNGDQAVKITDTLSRKILRKLKRGEMPPRDNKKGIAQPTEEEAGNMIDFLLEPG